MKISIIIPAYNAEKTITLALESVFAQTYTNWEVVIIDDGSDDRTREVVSPFLADERVQYMYQENAGTGKARNVGVAHSSGDLIAFLDADDFWHEDKLRMQVNHFADEHVVVSYTEVLVFRDDPKVYTKISRNFFTKPRSGKVYPFFAFHNIITLSSSIVRRSAFEQVGGFEENRNLMTVEDFDFWMKIVRCGLVKSCRQPLTYYRLAKTQKSNTYIQLKKIAQIYRSQKTFWATVGFVRVLLLQYIYSMNIIRIIKKHSFKKIIREIIRRLWLRFDFIAYPFVVKRIRAFVQDSHSVEDIVAFPASTHGVLVLGQKKQEIIKFLSLIRSHNAKHVLEIGTAQGGNLFVLSQVVQDGGIITSLDLPGGHWGGGYVSRKSRVFQAFARPNQTISLIRANSHHYTSLELVRNIFKDTKIDVLFIDGDHTYDGVKQDFEMYSPLVRKGGIVAFHDIALPADSDFGVREFWLEIRDLFESYEYIEHKDQQGYGIGVVIIS